MKRRNNGTKSRRGGLAALGRLDNSARPEVSARAAAELSRLVDEVRQDRHYVCRFLVKYPKQALLIKACDVDWIESAANYALLHVGGKTHIVRETMSALESKLNPREFQRISRSAIVNLDRVKELHAIGKGQYSVLLTTGKHLSMTRGLRELQRSIEVC